MQLTAEQWQRYIDNTCSETERKAIYTYLQGLAPGELETMLEDLFPEQSSGMPDPVATRLDRKLEQATGITLRPVRRRISKTVYIRWAAAASILFFAGLALFYFLQASSPARQQQAQVSIRNISNTSTHVQKAILPDGSQVWLSPQTTLQVPDDFGSNNRELALSGQGYFEVMHDPAKPFVVNAGGLQTRVLGTHFNIEAYPAESHSTVSLTHGKVMVRARLASGTDSFAYLQPGSKLVYQNKESRFAIQPVALQYEESWKNGSLVFDELPASDVFLRLEQRFGKKILFNPQRFRDKKFTATYPRGDLRLILSNLAFVQGFHYREQGDSIVINH